MTASCKALNNIDATVIPEEEDDDDAEAAEAGPPVAVGRRPGNVDDDDVGEDGDEVPKEEVEEGTFEDAHARDNASAPNAFLISKLAINLHGQGAVSRNADKIH